MAIERLLDHLPEPQAFTIGRLRRTAGDAVAQTADIVVRGDDLVIQNLFAPERLDAHLDMAIDLREPLRQGIYTRRKNLVPYGFGIRRHAVEADGQDCVRTHHLFQHFHMRRHIALGALIACCGRSADHRRDTAMIDRVNRMLRSRYARRGKAQRLVSVDNAV